MFSDQVDGESSKVMKKKWSQRGDMAADLSRTWIPGGNVGGDFSLDKEETRILDIICSEPISLGDICRELQMPSNECFTKVRRLESVGMLERIQDCENIHDSAVRVKNLYKAIKK